jgi:predicted nucleotide-binding protein (sugar kinase/HSP70/actin superfamily)
MARAAYIMVLTDVLEDLRRKIRPYELIKGETNRLFDKHLTVICDNMAERGARQAHLAYRRAIDEFCRIKYDRSRPRPGVFINGEYLLTFHSGSNFYVEDYLEKHGMEVQLPRMADVYRNLMLMHVVSELKDFRVLHSPFDVAWAFVGDKFFDIVLDHAEDYATRHPLSERSIHLPQLAKYSDPIIHRSIQSGEGFLMVADILHHAEQGVKSFIMLQPWGCLPNHVCGRGMVKRIKEEYPAIQILPLDYDPDTSFANIENRLQMLIMNAQSDMLADNDDTADSRPRQAVRATALDATA